MEEPFNGKKSAQRCSKVGQIAKKQNLDSKEAIDRQNEMNERIVSEIDIMCQEAKQFIQSSFEKDFDELYLANKDKNLSEC